MLPTSILLLSGLCAHASEVFGDYAYYSGDPHAHTVLSGDALASDTGSRCPQCGAFATVIDYAASQGLDWVAFSDHTNDGTRAADATAFADFLAAQLAHDDASGLVIVPAAELAFKIGGVSVGHRNLLLFGDDATLASLTVADASPNGDNSTEIGSCGAIDVWMDAVTATWGDALLIPHHPYGFGPAAVDWSCHSESYEPAVEIYSHWGTGLGWDRSYDEVGYPQTGHSVHDAMDDYGLHLGFMGGTDSHDTRPGDTCEIDLGQPYGGGVTMIVADASETFVRGTIHDAIVAHSTYASTGPMVPMTVTWFVDGVEVGHLGEDIELDAGAAVAVRVAIPAEDGVNALEAILVTPSGEITLDWQGDGTWEATIAAADLPPWLYAAVSLEGVPYEPRAGCDDGGVDTTEWLWASPSWFTVVDADADADGYTLGDGDCDDADAAVHPGAGEIWYDGVDQDCDGLDDYDADRDGYRPVSLGGSDCDDADATVRRPAAGHRVPPDCGP